MRGKILGLLRQWGYEVWWRKVNTRGQGVPQSRQRMYMVAIAGESVVQPFSFPKDIDHEPLEAFLDKDEGEVVAAMPMSRTAQRNLQSGRQTMMKAGVHIDKVPCIIDMGASPRFKIATSRYCLCITKGRASTGGYYLTTRKRVLSWRELSRLQGLPPGWFDFAAAGVREPAFRGALGNAMSVNVLQRLLPRVLYSAGLLQEPLRLPRKFSSRLH